MSTLDIRNVGKVFGEMDALKDVSIDIQSGEFIVLVGPSGCGKSTLMNCIAGLEKLNSGNILIGNEDVTHVSPKNRDIAMVFQSYALYPSMNVYKNIAFALEIRKLPRNEIDEKVKKVATILQIEHLLKRKPSQLSGGQRQRVAMGRALAREPKIYLFDEPLSNLDAKLRVEMRTEIKKLHQRLGTTIVYVTHDQIEAMTLADRIAVMRDGELLQLGTPQEIYDNPVNMFVAGFMGSPAMNFIPCNLNKNGKGYQVSVANGSGSAPVNLELPQNVKDLNGWAEQEVVLGIRPEHITHVIEHELERPHVSQMSCKLDVAEPTGADTLAIVRLNEREVTCRVDPRTETIPGKPISLMLDMNKASVFDPKTESRIL